MSKPKKHYYIDGVEITRAEAAEINRKNQQLIIEAAAGNFAALMDLITAYSIGKGGI